MKTKKINRGILIIESIRWSIQFLIVLLAIPYGFIAIFMPMSYLSPKFGDPIGFLVTTVSLLFYYLISVYFHYLADKTYTFKKPWTKSIRVYATFFSMIPLLIVYLIKGKISFPEYFEIFFIFSIIYTWLLSEYLSKKMISDRNLAFNFPFYFSNRFILFVMVILLLILTSHILIEYGFSDYLIYEKENRNSFDYYYSYGFYNIYDVYDFYEIIKIYFINFIKKFGVILFYIYPFLILNFISELKNRSLNKSKQ